jgi:hypothetical protein
MHIYRAALPAIQAAHPIAAKNAIAIQSCESVSLFIAIATAIVAATISDTTAITIKHMKNTSLSTSARVRPTDGLFDRSAVSLLYYDVGRWLQLILCDRRIVG